MKKVTFFFVIALILSVFRTYAENIYYDQKGAYWYQSEDGTLYDDKGHYLYRSDNSYQNVLANLGAVPSGSRPKAIIEDGGKPGYYQTDPLSNAKRGFEKYQKDRQEQSERDLDNRLKAAKLYKEMVDSGYTPMQAWESVLKDLGFPPPGEGSPTDLGFVPER